MAPLIVVSPGKDCGTTAICRALMALRLTVAAVAAVPLTACTDSARLADAGPAATRIAALHQPTEMAGVIVLPALAVFPSGGRDSPRAGRTQALSVPRFRVWAGYDSDVALHPYTSGLGPSPEGTFALGSVRHIKPSLYERYPFME